MFANRFFSPPVFSSPVIIAAATEKDAVLTGKAAMGDWTSDAPGVTRKIQCRICRRLVRSSRN